MRRGHEGTLGLLFLAAASFGATPLASAQSPDAGTALPPVPPPPGAQQQVPPPPGAQQRVPPPTGAQQQVPPPTGAQQQVPPPPGTQQQVPPPPGAQQPPPEQAYGPPPAGPQTNPYAPTAPPTAAEQLGNPAPGARYGVESAPPASVWDGSAPRAREPSAPPSDRRAGAEMIELYIAGGGWGVTTGIWLVVLGGDPEDTGGGALPILLGGGGAILVYGIDAAVGGLPHGVPASIAMGALLGLFEGGFSWAAFESSIPDDETGLTLLWGGATLGALGGALLGTQLRPTPGDARLVASAGLWGAYFTGLGTIVAGSEDGDGWPAILGGLNAGVLLGFLLAPAIDWDAGRVMLLNAGVGVGSLAGLLVSTMISADSAELDVETTALTVGVGGLMGLVGSYLLFRPSDRSEPAARAAAEFTPYVAPVEGGAMIGVGASM